ncbi:MAG: polysaccharide biosynthesis protein [Candidatus Binatia bacterium]
MVSYRRASRYFFLITIQLVLVLIAHGLAFAVRFDGEVPVRYIALFEQGLLWLMIIRGGIFFLFRLYGSLWRYSGTWELQNIIAAVVVSTVGFATFMEAGSSGLSYPRSVLIIDAVFLICLLGGVRLVLCLIAEWRASGQRKRVLVYGAGDAGERIVSDMKRRRLQAYLPIGFIDDNPVKTGMWIHGIPVLGTDKDLSHILAQEKPDEILVAMPSETPIRLRAVVKTLEPFKIPIKTLPNLADIIDGTVTVNQIRDLALEDLLARPPIQTDFEPVRRFVHRKRVLVTGAGGSIGSELCRQLARCEPEALLMLDKAESALYDIEMELQRKVPGRSRTTLLVDITNAGRLHDVFMRHTPEIVFHAAAYKHVPMMERHPGEAVLNNIIGTRRLCELSVQHGVETFVQISTDKAVNPTNVMGASKRVGELFVQAIAHDPAACGQTTFCAVRFGNVLGSNGSVVPLFLEQIRQGGPVTVTHPDITRYFMTIPEASQLVLQAATLATGGEIFVLDMGEQIRVLDMARHLIRLSGFVPEDIPISFTGLRPGEKLYEELVGADEKIEPSGVQKINRVQLLWEPVLALLATELTELEWLATQGRTKALRALLQEIVPTFCSSEAEEKAAYPRLTHNPPTETFSAAA